MRSLFQQSSSQRGETTRRDKRLTISFSRNSLFGARFSDEWRQQVDFTAGVHRPSDAQFPWALLRKHTDAYIKKKGKGKFSQADVDMRLGVLISTHDAKDIAVASCAHAMTPASVRAILNVQLNVAPATFYGLEMYLQSLIAANHCNPASVNHLEAQWAQIILPYASEGAGAAGRYLEGVRWALCRTDTPHLNSVPEFGILISRALDTFASQLDGFRLKSQWKAAYLAVAWMSTITKSSPAVTPPGKILPEHLLDTQFPLWRIYSVWQPDQERISMLEGQDSAKLSVLPDLLALEGPDFATGQCSSLREGIIAQYGATRPLMQFRGLLVEVNSCSREELRESLTKVATLMQIALKKGGSSFKLFTQITIGRAITQENLQILDGVFRCTVMFGIDLENALVQVLLARPDIGGRNLIDLSYIILALDHPQGGDIREVLLRPWLIQGIEKCLLECQNAVRTHIERGLKWTHLLRELHGFCQVLQNSEYVLPLLTESTRQQLGATPAANSLKTLLDIYEADRSITLEFLTRNNRASTLKNAIEAFFIDCFMEKGTASVASCSTIQGMSNVWTQTESLPRRRLAIIVTILSDRDYGLEAKLLSQVAKLPDAYIKSILQILESPDENRPAGCIQFTDLLSKPDVAETMDAACWNGILYYMLKEESDKLIDYAIDHFSLLEWFEFMMKLNALFADIINDLKANPPQILQLKFHSRTQILFGLPAIMGLEEALGDRAKAAFKCIFKGESEATNKHLSFLLRSLTKAQGQPVEKLMQEIVCHLSADGKNASTIADCVTALFATSETGHSACQQILDSIKSESVPAEVHEVEVAGWLENEDDDDLNEWDKFAIKALADVFDVRTYEGSIPLARFIVALEYYEEQEAQILAEADRLEDIKDSLKAQDSDRTKTLLKQIGYPDISQLDEELLRLPLGIVDFVEKHSENEIEISFPLDAFTELQRAATGIGRAKTLLVRMFIHYDSDAPNAFCMHLDDGTETPDIWENAWVAHTPWVYDFGEQPHEAFCHGRQTLLTYQLCRVLYRHMNMIGELGVTGIHALMKRWLSDYALSCVVCGFPHRAISSNKTTLRKPLPCTGPHCTKLWNSLPLTVRIPEIRTDPFAVDLLLTGVYVAASSGRMELLPGCPISGYNGCQNVRAILNTIPSLTSFSFTSGNISEVLQGCHKDAERLLIWACTYFRGLISSASGICRIANLPAGTHQFVLANANPQIEKAFHDKLPRYNPQTRVLFHGTSLDRLPSILTDGLKIQSGTSLQRTGAAHGRGIYLAEDPATSFSYSPSAISWTNSGLNNMRVLLGCEVIGGGNRVSNGIHVIKDEDTVMVRYVFLMNNSAYAPNANHITTPMLSAMCAMRSGAV